MWVLCMRHINQNIRVEVKSTQLMLPCLQKFFIIYTKFHGVALEYSLSILGIFKVHLP